MKAIFTFFLCSFFLLNVQAQTTQNFLFESDGFNLVGTYHIPDGNGPFPAVILVHGSGPTDRNATVPINDLVSNCLYPELVGQDFQPFLNIAEYLSSNGILVMTYDKRSLTHGAFLNPFTNTPYDFITDVNSAVDVLKERDDVDDKCIVLAGHSQGASFIPIVAKTRNDIAGLISLAGATQPIDSIVAKQNQKIYTDCFNQPKEGQEAFDAIIGLFAQVRSGSLPDTQPLEVKLPGSPKPMSFGFPVFWKDWIDISEEVIDNYKAADHATLIIHGDYDFNVDIEDSYELNASLKPARTQANFFQGINHFLSSSTSVEVHEPLLETMKDWILNVKSTVNTQEIVNKEENIKIKDYGSDLNINFTTDEYNSLNVYSINGVLLSTQSIENMQELNYTKGEQNGLLVFQFIGEHKIYTQKILNF